MFRPTAILIDAFSARVLGLSAPATSRITA